VANRWRCTARFLARSMRAQSDSSMVWAGWKPIGMLSVQHKLAKAPDLWVKIWGHTTPPDHQNAFKFTGQSTRWTLVQTPELYFVKVKDCTCTRYVYRCMYDYVWLRKFVCALKLVPVVQV
jgi:hypothetical protein